MVYLGSSQQHINTAFVLKYLKIKKDPCHLHYFHSRFGIEFHPQGEVLDNFGWIPLFAITIVLMSTSLGVTPIHHLLLGELYPSDIRTLGLGLTQSISFGVGSIHIKLFPAMLASLQVYTTNVLRC